jgi:hypothetical protein
MTERKAKTAQASYTIELLHIISIVLKYWYVCITSGDENIKEPILITFKYIQS